jgi:hypothetical protein
MMLNDEELGAPDRTIGPRTIAAILVVFFGGFGILAFGVDEVVAARGPLELLFRPPSALPTVQPGTIAALPTVLPSPLPAPRAAVPAVAGSPCPKPRAVALPVPSIVRAPAAIVRAQPRPNASQPIAMRRAPAPARNTLRVRPEPAVVREPVARVPLVARPTLALRKRPRAVPVVHPAASRASATAGLLVPFSSSVGLSGTGALAPRSDARSPILVDPAPAPPSRRVTPG